ncbi:MAG: hypothetical protein ACJATD_000105 [Alloalcanivorax sp.]|jgi:uncharacterized protein (DUF983 family)
MVKHKYIPPADNDELVLAWLRRARESQMTHYEMAEHLSGKGAALGVPVIVVNSIVSVSAFSSLTAEIIPNWSKLVVGFISIVAAIMVSLQTFFKYSERADNHRATAAEYGAIRRDLEMVYVNLSEKKEKEDISIYRDRLDELSRKAMYVPPSVFEKVQKRLNGKPNINGGSHD